MGSHPVVVRADCWLYAQGCSGLPCWPLKLGCRVQDKHLTPILFIWIPLIQFSSQVPNRRWASRGPPPQSPTRREQRRLLQPLLPAISWVPKTVSTSGVQESNLMPPPVPPSRPPRRNCLQEKRRGTSQGDKVVLKYFPLCSHSGRRGRGAREAGRGDTRGLIGSGDSTVSTLGKD